MKRTTSTFSLAVALWGACVSLSAHAADLSGTWVMKSPGPRSHAGTRIGIEQDGSKFTFKRWANMAGKETLTTDVQCTVGGGPCQVKLDGLQKNSRVTGFEWKAYAEGGTLIAELSSEWSGDSPKSQKYIYSLSPDGKTLTVEYVYIAKAGNGPQTMVDNRGKGEIYNRL